MEKKIIKIGRYEIEVRKGDYLLNNGACIQFCSGDNRAIAPNPSKRWFDREPTSVIVPQKMMKKGLFKELPDPEHWEGMKIGGKISETLKVYRFNQGLIDAMF